MPSGVYKHKSGYKRPPFSQEWKDKMSIAKTTNSLTYSAIHKWVVKTKGRAFGCERCGTKEERRYEWSCNFIPPTRNTKDYESLCVPCHRAKDGHNMIYKFSSRYKKHARVVQSKNKTER